MLDLTSNTINPGELRHQVQLVAMNGPLDEARQATEGPPVSTRARVMAMTGQARYQTEQFAERASHVITIRWRDGVATGNKVHFGDVTFEVVYPLDPDYRRRWLHLLCMELA